MSHSGSNPRRKTSTTHGYKSWSHSMTNILIPEVNMLKNSLTLAVFVPINLYIKFGFVSVNGTKETCFVDEIRRYDIYYDVIFLQKILYNEK